MKSLLYISGPPCSGKSQLCNLILENDPEYKFYKGDDYWNKFPDVSFSERSALTKEGILTSVEDSNDEKILLEWVPFTGSFLEKLKSICDKQNRKFTHIILYAPIEVLKARKMKRDGNDEIGPIDKTIIMESVNQNKLSFDTSDITIEEIFKSIQNEIK